MEIEFFDEAVHFSTIPAPGALQGIRRSRMPGQWITADI